MSLNFKVYLLKPGPPEQARKNIKDNAERIWSLASEIININLRINA